MADVNRATTLDKSIKDLSAHIIAVTEDPSIALNSELIGPFECFTADALPEADRLALLNLLSALIPTLQQHPAPVTYLIQTLVEPESVTFDNVLAIEPAIDFAAGLASTNADINLATLSLLGKAYLKPADAGIVAAHPHVVGNLIRLWLCTQDTAVAIKALRVLTGLLRVDISTFLADDNHLVGLGSRKRGQGPMWKRVFHDKDVYELFFSICNLTTAYQPGQGTKRGKTISQSRLFDFILTFPNFEQVVSSQLPDVEIKYGIESGGLLDFAAVHMVDWKDDVLMHSALIDFFSGYLGSRSPGIWPSLVDIVDEASDALSFLTSKGLHSRTLSYYLEPAKYVGTLELQYLYPRAAQYIAVYAENCRSTFVLRNNSDTTRIVQRLYSAIEAWSSAQWGQGQAPTSDLLVLTSIPRVTLLFAGGHPVWDIPVYPPNPHALNTLAFIFRGPALHLRTEQNSQALIDEAAMSRWLYLCYLNMNPDFWAHVVRTAQIVALKETALAAINLMDGVITANWASIRDVTRPHSDSVWEPPTETVLEDFLGHRGPLPITPTGAIAMLTGISQAAVLPYLLQPPQVFSQGDQQSAAYQVAVAKHTTVVHLDRRLKEAMTVPELEPYLTRWQPVIEQIAQCAARGVWGGTTAVGARVGTLEF